MRAFRFPLQRVLEVKKIREDIRKKDLARALKSEEKERKMLEVLHKKENDLKEAIKKKVEQIFNPAEIAIYHRYRLKLAADKLQQREKISEAKKVVKSKRDELIDASKEKEGLPKRTLRQPGCPYSVGTRGFASLPLDRFALSERRRHWQQEIPCRVLRLSILLYRIADSVRLRFC